MSAPNRAQDDLLAALELQAGFGADETLQEKPRAPDQKNPAPSRPAAHADARAQTDAPARPVRRKTQPPQQNGQRAVQQAALQAAAAQNLQELWKAIQDFKECPLKQHAKRTVIWRGNPNAKLVIIGEGPGAEEDASGKPFVGRAGKLLDEMLHWAGFDENSVFITNVVFWRPPKNRAPEPDEIASCMPFTLRQLTLIQPAIALLLGNTPLRALLPEIGKRGITRARGHWHALYPEDPSHGTGQKKGAPVATLPSFHPAYLLRSPGQKQLAWRDLLDVAQRWEQETGQTLPRRP